ncbi:MAG: YqgE/AlgH family protein [Pseudomonadota bacterium]
MDGLLRFNRLGPWSARASCALLLAACVAVAWLSSGVVVAQTAPPDNPVKEAPARFLIANESLAGSIFAQSVVLMLRHDSDGAFGLIVNKPTEATAADVFDELESAKERGDPVFVGGPVQTSTVFLLLRAERGPPGSHAVLPTVHLGTTELVLDYVFGHEWPADDLRIVAGYAGWAAGQLEGEIARGDWRYLPATASQLFDIPARRLWSALQGRSRVWARGQMPPGPPAVGARSSVHSAPLAAASLTAAD